MREVIDKLRSGEQNKAEFWINKPGMFINIVYVAVRDAAGKFRGVLEMMQDCTHIRALEGSQTLLTWSDETSQQKAQMLVEEIDENTNETAPITEITPETRLHDLLKQYPEIGKRLPELAPEFKMLNSPLGKILARKANVRMMSERSGIPLDQLLTGIRNLIQ